ncbi:hypothetical protein [Ottowia sp.]|jgi:hypothetical protein|uniref:hypothetical protein n=1 Tax=Ottowia sp. TaxID=1898956 RepID=UPI0025E57996|nr:hypothetical protein [Ottowia sp.]MBK6615103.1 hypothetical protein [Ottowia sp.]MBK6746180.1 hypothetical protein [Ottowia sp.]
MEDTLHPAGRKASSPGFIQMGEALLTDTKPQHASIGKLVKMCQASLRGENLRVRLNFPLAFIERQR